LADIDRAQVGVVVINHAIRIPLARCLPNC
jgi:hypothetical protein